MIAPANLTQLIASSRLEELQAGIVAELKRLLVGVAIVPHPGKLDINDVLAKTIVSSPGVALGWSRMRGTREVGGGAYELPIDWTAYIITEDFADTKAQPPRRVGRDVVAWAIGSRLLQILNDASTPFWKLTGITDPAAEPAPEMRPVLTMKTAENAAAVYMVTWTQALILQGISPFDGETPGVAAIPDGMEFDLPAGELPPQILAILGREKADAEPEEDAA